MDRASKPVPEQAFEPLQTFDSCEDAIESAKQLASIQGYSLAIQRRTKNSEDVVSFVRLRCSKAFKYTPYDADREKAIINALSKMEPFDECPLHIAAGMLTPTFLRRRRDVLALQGRGQTER
ncbi:hypothetical protein E4U39_001781 [Claviceps sp. Clav50 group G5]|nr:hypothetical protein E4U39_001781 [Claviceps sp. Clav50 group G5]